MAGTSPPSSAHMHDDSNPPTAFTHAEWCAVRDELWNLGKPHNHDKLSRRMRAYRAALAMNVFQRNYHYRVLADGTEVGGMAGVKSAARDFVERACYALCTSGTLKTVPATRNKAERVELEVPERDKTTGAIKGRKTSTACFQWILHMQHADGYPAAVVQALHTVRGAGNAGHEGLADLQPKDKPAIAHAMYRVATAMRDWARTNHGGAPAAAASFPPAAPANAAAGLAFDPFAAQPAPGAGDAPWDDAFGAASPARFPRKHTISDRTGAACNRTARRCGPGSSFVAAECSPCNSS